MSIELQKELELHSYLLERATEKPSLLAFKNANNALEMLHRHVVRRSKICIHSDVDMDGIGSSYIMDKFLLRLGMAGRVRHLINKEKVHGISQKHVDYINSTDADLLIILDSSSNEIEYIKKMRCDVIVIDHHELLHEEIYGDTALGKYVIVSNMVNNFNPEEVNEWIRKNTFSDFEKLKEYEVESRMSCGLVLYELLRLYELAYDTGSILEENKLYQWVGITLFSDAVELRTQRNHYYIDNTVNADELEVSLYEMMKSINKYQRALDKSFINFSLVPLINKAIRAGQSVLALDIALNRPQDIMSLSSFSTLQEQALELASRDTEEYESFVLRDITNTGISRNYCGVIATKLCGDKHKNAAVYFVCDGIAEGSFRGRVKTVDYRRYFAEYSKEIYAQGHKSAFGFKVKVDDLYKIMSKLVELEEEIDRTPLLTAGAVPETLRGKYHIEDMMNFKREGMIWKLALYNSKVSVEESITILTVGGEATLTEQIGKLYKYDILGSLHCIAFEEIEPSNVVEILPEFSNKELKLYIKKVNYI